MDYEKGLVSFYNVDCRGYKAMEVKSLEKLCVFGDYDKGLVSFDDMLVLTE